MMSRAVTLFRSRLLLPLAVAALLLAVASSIVALTCRDCGLVGGLVYFGTPWLVRLGLVSLAAWALWPRLRRWAKVAAVLVALHALGQGWGSFRSGCGETEPPGKFHAVLWNAGRRLADMPGEWPQLTAPATRVAVFIEAGDFPGDSWQRFTASLPGFEWRQLAGGIVLGVRGRVTGYRDCGDGGKMRCHRVEAEIDGELWTVLAVDLPAQPWLPRGPMLDQVRRAAAAERCLILGDFNTPPDARGFDAWRSTLHRAEGQQSAGFGETWPYWIPLLTLDQLWHSTDIQSRILQSHATLRSDHRRMTFELIRIL